jgi:hypothetical protein
MENSSSAIAEILQSTFDVTYNEAMKIVDAYALHGLDRDLRLFSKDELMDVYRKTLSLPLEGEP